MIWGSLVALIIAPLGVFGQTVSGTAPAGGGCTFAAVGFVIATFDSCRLIW